LVIVEVLVLIKLVAQLHLQTLVEWLFSSALQLAPVHFHHVC